jgi:hypothetical protein
MRLLRSLLVICIGLWQCSQALVGAEFRLNNGDIIRGEAVSFDDDGLVVRLDIGGHTPRIGWSKLTQETLKQLSANPEAAGFVEPFIEIPPVPKEKKEKKQIPIKPVPRVERVASPNFFASLATPAGLMIVVVLLAANVYAAYEIARFRYRSPAMVCGLSILFPVVAPAMFLAMPPSEPQELEGAALAEAAGAALAAGKATTGPLAKMPMASGLSIAQDKSGSSSAGTVPQTFKRGEYTFNRRFIETKFPGFFRVVPNEAEKDLVLAVRSGRDEHVAKRISRISSNEMHVQLVRGGAEVLVPFAEISEIQIRHKDAKA